MIKIKVRVKPNSGKQKIEEKEGYYAINLKSPLENNKANVELIKLLQKYSKREVKIISGFKSRNKILELK